MTNPNHPYRAATAQELELIAAPDALNSIKELAEALENISLTPGPKGDTGYTGPQGPQGIPGPQGAASTVPGPQGAASTVPGPAPFTILGAYNNGADYGYGDAVYYNGGTYVRTGNPNNPGYPPTPGSINASWTPIADKGDTGAQGENGLQGLQGEPGLDGDPLDFLNVSSNIVPTTTNLYTLGTSDHRWADIFIGPNTINITDTSTGANAALTVTDGILKIDGANQLQVGQLKFINNTIESTTGGTDIQIGLLTSSADIVMQRDVVMGTGKTIKFPDNTIQTTAYIPEEHYTHLNFIASVPLHDHGQAGHKKYDAFLDSEYLYVCSNNYVNDNTKIWLRLATKAGNW